MSKLLLNKRNGPFQLPPASKGGKVRSWAGGTTLTVTDEEGAKLVQYKDIVELKDGAQVKGPEGAKPVPAGTGVSGKAVVPGKDEPAKSK